MTPQTNCGISLPESPSVMCVFAGDEVTIKAKIEIYI